MTEVKLKVSKWGNSLAVRLPAEIVERLGLKEGDEVSHFNGFKEETVTLRRKKTRAELLESLRRIRATSPIPADYVFKRSDAYDEE